MSTSLRFTLLLVAGWLWGVVVGWAGPVHQMVTSFDVPSSNPGYGGLVAGPGGYYWGTTQGGGAAGFGTVFKLRGDGSDVQTVLYFTGTGGSRKGRAPFGGLVSDGAGFFWGTTNLGGAGNFGTVYKVNASTGVLSTVVEFTNTTGANKGAYPYAGLVSDGAGFLWGTTHDGGALGLGTVFKVNVGTGVLSTVVELTGDGVSNRGAFPYGGLVSDGAGSLWGTASYGGTLGYGTIFKINIGTGVLSTVVELTDNGATNKGSRPWAGLFYDGAGAMWGTTTEGGALGFGTLFKLAVSGGPLLTYVEFTNSGASNRGRTPSAPLVSDGLGYYWGTATAGGGGAGAGTVFKVNASTGVLTTLVEFTSNGASNKGASPYAPLLSDGQGGFLGTTNSGGLSGSGTVFKIQSGVLSTLVDFSASVQFGSGRAPYAGLVGDGAGSLWGVNSSGGGTTSSGTVFKLNPATGALSTQVKFTGNTGAAMGAAAYAGLASDGLGYLWGVTQAGGSTTAGQGGVSSGKGTIFKVQQSTGTMSTVLGFTGNGTLNRGAAPAAGLRSDGAGWFWGTTVIGGSNNFGTLFKVNAASGLLTTLVDFSANGASNKGSYPNGLLVSDGAGNFWGTTQAGGATDQGTIFKINATSGLLTTVVEFTGAGASNRGASPLAGLTDDGAGSLWGTTQAGGAGFGTLFKIAPATGQLTTVVEFTSNGASNKGAQPSAGLALDGAGSLWGTTAQGGASASGTVFKVNLASGALTTLVEFTGAGTQPLAGGFPGYGALYKHTDGHFYGTTVNGGFGGGTLYRLWLGPLPVTQAASAISFNTATLHGTINPNGLATTASFEIGTDPQLAGAAVISAGTTSAGNVPEAVTAAVTGLIPGVTYYYRVRAQNPENPNLQTGAIVPLTALAEQPPVAGSMTATIPAYGPGVVALGALASDPDNTPASLSYTILNATGVNVTPVFGSEYAFVPNGTWSGSGTITYRVTDPYGLSAEGTITVVDLLPPSIAPSPNLTVEATSTVGTPVTFTPNTSDNVAVTSLTAELPSGSTFPLGTTMVTLTAMDAASNMATENFTVTVQDSTAPVITPPGNVVVPATGPSGRTVTYPPAVASDLVGVTSLTYSRASGSVFPNGTSTVTVTARDQAGNVAMSAFTVTVADTTAPVLTLPGNVIAEATSEAGASVSYPEATALDLVGVTSLTYSCISGTVFPIGTTPVTVTARDQAGNTATGTFTVIVRDTAPPALTVPGDRFVEATSSAGAVVYFDAASATDSVGVVALTYSRTSGSVFGFGTTLVTVTATDQAGNSASAAFAVTVADTTPPALAGPGNLIAEATSSAGAVVNFAATATDLAGGFSFVSYSHPSGSVFEFGTTLVTVTATDTAGNSTSDSFSVTVADTTPPALSLPGSVSVEASSSAGAIVAFAQATATDAVEVFSITSSHASGSTFPIGVTTVTVAALDSAGNSGAGTFTVTVTDTTPPVVIAPGNVFANASGGGGMVVNFPPATATDAVGVTNLSYSQASGSLFASGTTVVTVTASDAAGRAGSASFSVTVNPPPAGGTLSVSPAAGLKAGDPVHLSASGWTDAQQPLSYQFFVGAASQGGAGSVSELDLVAPAAGTHTVRVRVTDSLGAFIEETQSITVQIIQTGIASWRQANFGTPNGSGPAADLADPNRNGIVNLLEYALNGNPLVAPSGSGAKPQLARSPGNALQLKFTRILDRTDLTLVVVAADSPVGPWSPLAMSVAGGSFAAVAPGAAVSETGTGATRNVTVTDRYSVNNSAHRKRFLRLKVVLGNSSPLLVLNGEEPLVFEAAATFADPGATAIDPEDGPLAPLISGNTVIPNVVGTYFVTWQATDGSGNIGTATRTVNVVDTTAPVVTPPANIVVTASTAGGMVVNYPAATVSDVVGVASTSYSKASGTLFATGTTTVVVTAADAAGNTGTASFTVTVNPPQVGGTLAISPAGGLQQGDLLHLSASGWADAQAPLSYQFFLGEVPLAVAGNSTDLDLVAPAPGTYTVRLRTTYALGAFVEATRTFTVQASMASWRHTHFGTTIDAAAAGDLADPNRNGLVNLLEYALNGNPTGTASGPKPQTARSPGNALQLKFTRYLDRTDLTLTVIAADSLSGPWTDLATSVAGGPFVPVAPGATVDETGSGASRNVTVTDVYSVTNPAHPHRFLRLRVRR